MICHVQLDRPIFLLPFAGAQKLSAIVSDWQLLYKYSTISHLMDILGQLAPTMLPRPRYCGCFSVNNFLNIGRMAVSPSSNSDSELAPNNSGFVRCLRCFSGATFGDEWWCEWCCSDFINLRWGVDECTLSRSRSLSVSLWPICCCLCLCRCFERFFSDTLRCIGPDGDVVASCEPCWYECECSWQRCDVAWLRGDCRCFACDKVCVSQRSLCDTTKLPLIGVPICTLTRRCGSWFSTITH